MIMLQFVCVLVILSTAAAAPSQQCANVLKAAGLSKNYNETIAHAVHSMTVEVLTIFKPTASVNNKIPTVNQDLSGGQKVLGHAPDSHPGKDFTTQTMNIVDDILSHIGHSEDGLGPNWSSIERVAHTYHMWDLWMTIKQKAWFPVIESPPSKDVCACLVDVDSNGITRAVKWIADHYETGTPITLLNRPIPKLVDASAWAVWKQRLLHYYTPQALTDAATYLYCAL